MEHVPPTGAQAHYEAALSQGRFEIQRCNDCHAHVFYPRQVCPHCAGMALQWVQPTGLGTVYATTTVCVDPKNTYDVTLIDLDEGVRLMSRVVDRAAGQTPIGLRVKARVAQNEARSLLVFDTHGEAA
jgi:uncharacterized OB-fold protein